MFSQHSSNENDKTVMAKEPWGVIPSVSNFKKPGGHGK
jgi:hypothetical protein